MKYYVGDILRERHVEESGEERFTNIFVIERKVSNSERYVCYNTFVTDSDGTITQYYDIGEKQLDECEYVGRMDMSMMIGSQKEYEIVRERCEELKEERDRIQKVIDLNEKRFGK